MKEIVAGIIYLMALLSCLYNLNYLELDTI